MSHHRCCLVVQEQLLGHVLHVLQGLGLGQPPAVFNPSRGIPQRGEELDWVAGLLVYEIKAKILLLRLQY